MLSNKEVRSLFRRKNITNIGKAQENLLRESTAWQHNPEEPVPETIKQDIINHHRRLRQPPRKLANGSPTAPQSKKNHGQKPGERSENAQPASSNNAASPVSSEGTPLSDWSLSPKPSGVIKDFSPSSNPITLSTESPSKKACQPHIGGSNDVQSSDPEPMDVELPLAGSSTIIRNSSAYQPKTSSGARAPSPQQTPTCAQPVSEEMPFSEARVPETVITKRPTEAELKQRKKLKVSAFVPIVSPELQHAQVQNNKSLRNIPNKIAAAREHDRTILHSIETRQTRPSVDMSVSEPKDTEVNTPVSFRSTTRTGSRSFQELKSRAERAYEAGLHMQRLNHDPYEVFTEMYPEYTETYSGSLRQFIKACIYLEYLQQRRKLKESCWDELIRAFASGYIPYLNSNPPEALSMIEWFSDTTGPNVFEGGVITRQNLQYAFQKHPHETKSVKQAAKEREIEEDMALDMTSLAPVPVPELPPLPVERTVQPPPVSVQTNREPSPELGSEKTMPPPSTMVSSAVRKPRRSMPSYLEGRRGSTPINGKPRTDRTKMTEHFKRRISQGFVSGTPTSSSRE